MLSTPWRRLVTATTLAAAYCGLASVPTTSRAAEACTNVEVVFARGTGERVGLGSVGTPLVSQLKSALSGKSVGSYAVNYAAASNQSSAGPGATDMTRRIVARAKACPSMQFVIGGYSQGASVTDIAIGMNTRLGRGEVINGSLQGRISAVTVFGNPSRTQGQSIDRNGGAYASKAYDDCNAGDPVCGAGRNFSAHLAYARDGSVTAAVSFVRARIR